MSDIKLLLVEDSESDQLICQNAVSDFNEDNTEFRVCLEVCGNVTEAEEKLKQSDFDGVIIDMKLTNSGEDEGNQVIEQIKNSFSRIPVVIFTGTPNVAVQHGFPVINIYEKGGDVKYSQIIEEFCGIYRTGLTKILGGKGSIEKMLATIFTENLIPALRTRSSSGKQIGWIKHAESDSPRTEKALLRYTLNHLLLHLDNDINRCYPEEMYIYPPIDERINTGSILKKKDSERYFIVMNPACDLAERGDGGCNTDRALLVEIQPLEEIYPDFNWDNLSRNDRKELQRIYKNNKSLYYHRLPEVEFYPGGVINFRRVSTYTEEEINTSFGIPKIQISAPFLKDMISRFSSYYARQGQPEIDVETDESGT
ncbi:hypothetical protein PL75_01115 [Neisseria arctica]|uniref:Response regulatory domain-containing protein n=1 Tax=Neisseria arctica TaxID=1470200 RepID=A0A0J0YU07_9NEIS|nr:response regulator [Neisseria arctica]KLT73581.1 hypothetical protein PL75_01115 [Neisseria arctica]UOO85701.1 response regulator [Neisseria arctica]